VAYDRACVVAAPSTYTNTCLVSTLNPCDGKHLCVQMKEGDGPIGLILAPTRYGVVRETYLNTPSCHSNYTFQRISRANIYGDEKVWKSEFMNLNCFLITRITSNYMLSKCQVFDIRVCAIFGGAG